ncbi:MAG: L-fucose/L-arabinose isomerase family protein [Prolixibacteraceae bacterium]|jgi:L-fucose isomerase-like protein|nr:L-fucose/L-arabinose isomerase family protein [Prolixibacteraceae bacterium]
MISEKIEKLRIAYIPLAKGTWLNERGYKTREQSIEELKKNPVVEIVTPDFIVTNDDEAYKTCEFFRNTHVDVMLVQFIGFAPGSIMAILATAIAAPIVLWSIPEAPMTGGRLEVNSFCGSNLNAFILSKLKRKYKYIFSSVECIAEKLAPVVRVLSVIKTLRRTKIGLVGSRVPGFYTSNFNELELRRILGVEVQYITLLELIHVADRITSEEIDKVLPRFTSIERDKVTDEEVFKSVRLYLSFRKLAEKYNLDAYAIKCWSEFGDIYGIGVCSCLSFLSTDGIICACEADINGAVNMIINNLLCSQVPFFCDFISYDEHENTGIVWHCGAASETLCKADCSGKLCKHGSIDGGNKKGVTYEFPLKSGPVTFCSFGEGNDGHRLLLTTGNAFDTQQIIKGNPLNIKFDCSVKDLVETIIYQGFAHHYVVIHNNNFDDLVDLCKWLDIEVVTVKDLPK